MQAPFCLRKNRFFLKKSLYDETMTLHMWCIHGITAGSLCLNKTRKKNGWGMPHFFVKLTFLKGSQNHFSCPNAFLILFFIEGISIATVHDVYMCSDKHTLLVLSGWNQEWFRLMSPSTSTKAQVPVAVSKISTYACVYVCICTCMHVWIYVSIHKHITKAQVPVAVSRSTPIRVCMYVLMYVCMYAYTQTHVDKGKNPSASCRAEDLHLYVLYVCMYVCMYTNTRQKSSASCRAEGLHLYVCICRYVGM